MHLEQKVVDQFAVIHVWALKYGRKARSSRFSWSVSLESLSKDERRSGAPNKNFRKISVRMTICNLEFLNICCKICLPASPRIFEHLKNGIIAHFNGFFPLKGHLEFSGAFFLSEIFEKVSFDPYNFRITRLSARKSEQMKNF